ncbi:MAG: hypothetical protein IPP63_19290 [Chloracidobacterium sp.]|nr:hypothetical protein [Chloracidobacterium sp.]
MNVLVIGSGGREHAICRSFSKSPRLGRLFCANGNAGIASVAECVPIKPDDIAGYSFAEGNEIGLTFVGGETSCAWYRRRIRIARPRVIGPNRAAANWKCKSFAKDFMARHGVPTAKFVTAHSPGFAILERKR